MTTRWRRAAAPRRRRDARTVLALAASFLVLLTAAAAALSAQATEGRQNGRITFGKLDRIWVANSDGTHQQRLTDVTSFFSDWSPDGSRITFDFFDDVGEHVATMAPDGRDIRQLTFGSTIQEVPKWSPDGRWITFDASRLALDDPAFSTSIWMMRADGSKPRQLTSDGFDVEPVFSPDGSQIAFARITGTSPSNTQLSAIYVVNNDGTHLHQVVAPLPGLEHPDWSPDSRWISFNIAPDAIDGPAPGSVMGVHPNGKGLRILRESTTQFAFFKPVWSPDGRKLLTGCHDNQAQIDKLCILGTRSRKVVVAIDDTPDPVNYPAWGSHPTNS